MFRLAYRQAEGLLGSVVGLLGLSLGVPDHTTWSRRAATLDVPRPRTGSTGAGADSEPMHLLVDSTASSCAARASGYSRSMGRRRVGRGGPCISAWTLAPASSWPPR